MDHRWPKFSKMKSKFIKQNICIQCDNWRYVLPYARRCQECTRKNDNITKVAAHKKRMSNPEYAAAYKAKKNAEYKERMKNPALKAKYLEQKKISYDKCMADPELKAEYNTRHNSNRNRRMADPEYCKKLKMKAKEALRKTKIKKNKQALFALKLIIKKEEKDEN